MKTTYIDRQKPYPDITHLITNPEAFRQVTGLPLLLSSCEEMRTVIERAIADNSIGSILERVGQLERLETTDDPVLTTIGNQIGRIVKELMHNDASSALVTHKDRIPVLHDSNGAQQNPLVVAFDNNGYFVKSCEESIVQIATTIDAMVEEMAARLKTLLAGTNIPVLAYAFTNKDVDPKKLSQDVRRKLLLLERNLGFDRTFLVRVKPHQAKTGRLGYPMLMMANLCGCTPREQSISSPFC